MKPALLIYFAAAISTFAADLGFSQMENGDRIEVTLHSIGCFHDSTAYYQVSKTNGAYLFCEYTITWSKGSPPEMLEKRRVGEINLSRKDIEGLDRLLKYYRGEKDASSTTEVTLLVEYFEKGKRVKVEHLKDGSGGYGLENRKDIVTFFELAARLQRQSAESGARE